MALTDRNQMCQDLRNFHLKFGLDKCISPSSLAPELSQFRIKFLQEELDEYKHAVETGDLEKQFDALLDLVYVAIGTADLHNFPWEEGWAEVQRANMSKERATSESQSKRGSSFDVIKPTGWRPPAIAEVLDEYRARLVRYS